MIKTNSRYYQPYVQYVKCRQTACLKLMKIADATILKKILGIQKIWPLRDSNTQPSDLESDALPLRQGVLMPTTKNIR